jgi:type III pantothenate kinase
VNDSSHKVIIVDAGNTSIKVACFLNGKLIDFQQFNVLENQKFQDFVSRHNSPPIFISSVLKNEILDDFVGNCSDVTFFKPKMKLPIVNSYQSPETLGMDRLANAVAIHALQEKGAKVAIDLGTCIKFDLVDEKGTYIGGSISPGLNMRYKALAHFTGKLPLLAPPLEAYYRGNDSKSSIHAGVIQGIQGELNHFISRYLQDYQGLTFFVTGGDAKFFEFPRKNNIFADENLTLFGLYKIYMLNA